MEEQRSSKRRAIDKSTVVGTAVAFAMVGLAIFLGGKPQWFVDTRSILIVFGGTFAVTVSCFSFSEVKSAIKAAANTVFCRAEDLEKTAMNAVEISEIARKKGFLELDKYNYLTRHNSFLSGGVNMIVDQVKMEELEGILHNEVEAMQYRHAKSVLVLRKAAEIAPAMGLIGTLIGLVQMLGSLQDPATIGPAMAVALLTTFYGAALSYMFFSPIASKLERNTKDEVLVAKIYIQAIKSIANKESPRKLEMLLNSILPPSKRINYYSSVVPIKREKKGEE